MSTDCPCTNISNSFKITKDGVLQSVLECEDCGKREIDLFTDKYPDARQPVKKNE